jgi:Uma2 family endonuclease
MRPEDGRKKGLWNSFRQQDGILPLCPDFVLELRSPSDRLPELQDKRAKYLTNESRLGWLIDPIERDIKLMPPSRTQLKPNPPKSR